MRLLPLCLLLLLAGCSTPSSKNDNHTEEVDKAPKRYGWDGDLYGDVKSIVITNYAVDNKLYGPELKADYSETHKFNDLGHTTEIYYDWDADKIIDRTHIYNYDDKNHIKSVDVYDYEKDNNVSSSYVYETDSRGNITFEAHYKDIILTYGSRYIYNADDLPIEVIHYDENSSLSSKGIIKYNDYNAMTSLTAYNAKGKMIQEIKLSYNIIPEKPSSAYSISYDEDSGDIDVITEYKYHYNEKKQEIKKITERKLEREYTEEHYEYDAMGNLQEIKRYESEARILKSITKFTIDYREQKM